MTAGYEYSYDDVTSGPYQADAVYTETNEADPAEDWASDEEHDAWLRSLGYTVGLSN